MWGAPLKNEIQLSALVIAKDEERDLPACLDSLAFADEIVVVDDRSADGTAEIARAKGARVVEHAMENFAAQRNFALEQARGGWVLFLDADERITPELAGEIRSVIAGTPLDGFEITRINHFLGRQIRHGDWAPIPIPRLFRRGKVRYEREVHELARVDGKMGTLRGTMLHFTDWSYEDRLAKSNFYTSIEARRMVEQGVVVGWFHLVWQPLRALLRSYLYRRGFLDGTVGLIIALHAGYATFVEHAKAWEAQQGKPAAGEGKRDRPARQ